MKGQSEVNETNVEVFQTTRVSIQDLPGLPNIRCSLSPKRVSIMSTGCQYKISVHKSLPVSQLQRLKILIRVVYKMNYGILQVTTTSHYHQLHKLQNHRVSQKCCLSKVQKHSISRNCCLWKVQETQSDSELLPFEAAETPLFYFTFF